MKKFENIILASDIDGTFVCQYNFVNPRNYERVKYFVDNGGHFLLSSGRNSKDICVAGDILRLVNTPCVLCNGAMLYDISNDVIENPVYIETEPFVEALRYIDKTYPDVGFRASYEGGFVIRETDKFIINELERYDTLRFAAFASLDDFKKYKMFKAVIRAPRERIAEVERDVVPKYEGAFTFTRSSDQILEIMPKGINKSYQLKFLKDKLSRDKEMTLWCVGDYDNDIDMLRFADVAACPDNATDAVKAICSVHLCNCKYGAVGELVDVIEKNLNK